MQPKWFDAGAKDYGFPPLALLSLEFLLLGFLELKRYQGFKKTGKVCISPSQQTMRQLFSQRQAASTMSVRCIPHLLWATTLSQHSAVQQTSAGVLQGRIVPCGHLEPEEDLYGDS